MQHVLSGKLAAALNAPPTSKCRAYFTLVNSLSKGSVCPAWLIPTEATEENADTLKAKLMEYEHDLT